MTQNLERKDLVILVADKDIEFAVRGLLSRGPSFGIRLPLFDTYVHPERDPGCFLKGHDFLRPFYRTYSYAMVMFDCEGSGRENNAREELVGLFSKITNLFYHTDDRVWKQKLITTARTSGCLCLYRNIKSL